MRLINPFIQTNRSKVLGSVWSSMGIDNQSEVGVVRLSPRLKVNTSNVANQGLPVAFGIFDQKVFSICGQRVFKSASQDFSSAFTEDTSSGAVTNYDPTFSDMLVFNNALCATANNKLMSKATDGAGTGAWTQRATLTGSSHHKLAYLRATNRLYFMDGFTNIGSLDTSWVEATPSGGTTGSLQLSYSSGMPYTMIADGQNLWIGTVVTVPSGVIGLQRSAKVLRWDGASSGIQTEYLVKAGAVLAMALDERGTVHVFDSNGALSAFNGGGFTELGRLPIKRELLLNAQPSAYNSFIHPNGLQYTKNGTFQVLINNSLPDGTVIENLPSGIWEWSKETGFVHKQSLSYNPLGSTTITDYGQNIVYQVGALYNPDVYTASVSGKPTLLCGATAYTDGSTGREIAIYADDPFDTTQKYGYIVTTWIRSNQIQEMWQKLALQFRQLLASTDKITAKYRLTEQAPINIYGTWASTSTFTTTTNLTSYTGYEVEVLQGTGGGKCAHITAVSGSGPYTVTLDDTFTGVTSGTFRARVQNWKKIGSHSDQVNEFNIFPIEQSSPRIQIKVCMQFTGEGELYSLDIINKTHQPLT